MILFLFVRPKWPKMQRLGCRCTLVPSLQALVSWSWYRSRPDKFLVVNVVSLSKVLNNKIIQFYWSFLEPNSCPGMCRTSSHHSSLLPDPVCVCVCVCEGLCKCWGGVPPQLFYCISASITGAPNSHGHLRPDPLVLSRKNERASRSAFSFKHTQIAAIGLFQSGLMLHFLSLWCPQEQCALCFALGCSVLQL